MLGQMQEWPLRIHKVIDFAAIQHPGREIVSRLIEGPIHRTNYREIRQRSLKLAQKLASVGVKLGDRVATLAWNTHRHLETWYGITGIGAIYHTVNPRLFPEQIVWIMNHAEDKVAFVDLTFVPLLEAIADKLPTVERFVVLTDAAHMPATKLEERGRLRGMARRGRRRFPLGRIRRAHRRGPLLHLRHDRQSEGRALLAPLQRAAFDDVGRPRLPPDRAGFGGAADRADVPRQFLGPRLHRADARRQTGDAGRQARRRLGLRTAGDREGDLQRCGADRLVDAARLFAEGAQEALDPENGHHRRLRLPAGNAARIRGGLRRRSPPRLGHDGNEPARLDQRDQAATRKICRTPMCSR